MYRLLPLHHLLIRDYGVKGVWLSTEERTKAQQALVRLQMTTDASANEFIESLYAVCQRTLESLDFPGGHRVRLYRVVREKSITDDMEEKEQPKWSRLVQQRALSVWTDSEEMALTSAFKKSDLLVAKKFPLENILCCGAMFSAEDQSGEFIVMPTARNMRATLFAPNITLPEPDDEQEETEQ